jgi:signal transduction histidine kinase
MLAPPLVAAVLFAAVAVADRRQESAGSRRSGTLVHLAVTADELTNAYRVEVAEALEPAAPGVLTEALARRREATDTLAAQFLSQSDDLRSGHMGPELLRAGVLVAERFGEIPESRRDLAGLAAHAEAVEAAVGDLLARIPPYVTEPILARQASGYAALAHVRQLAVERDRIRASALPGSSDQADLVTLDAGLELWSNAYERSAGEVRGAELRSVLGGPTAEVQARLGELVQGEAAALTASAEEISTSSSRATIVAGATALLAAWLALTLAIVIGRRIVRPVQRLTDAAHDVARVQLPALLDAMEHGEAVPVQLDFVRRESLDEIGDLADAFNSIQTVALDVAERQGALLRKGVSELFVNLARRNQSLIERQLSCLDGLQSEETDPDRLDALFKLDHLSIRMRRHAENLLVLAGVEQTRRWSSDVSLSAVMRAAYGEIEHMARIDMGWINDVSVNGGAAADVAHIISELLENATSFSPPNSRVELSGYRAGDEFVVTVTDRGVGMSEDRLAEANVTLLRPPTAGLALSRSLGFVVISRLAARYGIRVTLATSPFGGILASVVLPASLLRASTAPAEPAAPPVASRPVPGPPRPVSVEHDIDHQLAALVSSAPASPASPGMPVRAGRAEGRTSSGLARRSGAGAGRPEPQPVEVQTPEPPPEPSATERPARNEGANVRAASALARRVPGKRTVPTKSDAAPAASATAEEKRARLDGYWQGLQRGRKTDIDE